MLPDSSTINNVLGSRKSSGELRYFNEQEDGEVDEINGTQLVFLNA